MALKKVRQLQPPKLPAIAQIPKAIMPLVRRGLRPKILDVAAQVTAETVVPPGLVATIPEWLVYEFLTKRGIAFSFQSSQLGGRIELGGAVADFVLNELGMVWRVQGEVWHIGDPGKEASDLVQKMRLTDEGYTVIDLYANDILQYRDLVCRDALAGREWRKPIG